MFNCGFCGVDSKPGMPLKLVVTARRKKEYPSLHLTVKPKKSDDRKFIVTKPGNGWEVVKEERMCSKCASSPIHAQTVALSDGNYPIGKNGYSVGTKLEAVT